MWMSGTEQSPEVEPKLTQSVDFKYMCRSQSGKTLQQIGLERLDTHKDKINLEPNFTSYAKINLKIDHRPKYESTTFLGENL